MFNLKEYQKKNNTVIPYEKLLEKSNKDFDLKPIDSKNFNKSLEKKDPSGLKNYEKLLDGVRENKDIDTITEKQLDKYKDVEGNKRGKVESEPLMDYGNKTEQESDKEFEDSKSSLPEEKHISDDKEIDDPEDNKKVVPVSEGNSQLLSNYKNRKDFRAKNKSASKELFNLDAKLYHVFRTAASESRELTKLENEFIESINAKKTRILIVD